MKDAIGPLDGNHPWKLPRWCSTSIWAGKKCWRVTAQKSPSTMAGWDFGGKYLFPHLSVTHHYLPEGPHWNWAPLFSVVKSPAGISWDHLPNNVFAAKSMFLTLVETQTKWFPNHSKDHPVSKQIVRKHKVSTFIPARGDTCSSIVQVTSYTLSLLKQVGVGTCSLRTKEYQMTEIYGSASCFYYHPFRAEDMLTSHHVAIWKGSSSPFTPRCPCESVAQGLTGLF